MRDLLLFTSGDVLNLVGLTQRQLAYWDTSAVAHPHGRSAQGSGSRRLYTLIDVLQLKLIRRLRQAGLPLQRIRQALINLSDMVDESAPLTELEVVTDGQRILVRRSDEQIVDPVARQYVLRLPLAHLLTEIEREMALSLAGSVSEGDGRTTAVVLHR